MAERTQNEFRMIDYHGANYKFTIWGVEYIRPHFHREVEVWAVLHGQLTVSIDGEEHLLKSGDLCIIDSFKIHELTNNSDSEIPIIMVMHIHSAIFAGYFPQAGSITFPFAIYNHETMDPEVYRLMFHDFLVMGIAYFRKGPYYQLRVAGLINLFFEKMLTFFTYESISEEEKRKTIIKTSRLKKITEYIYEHYSEKLLLSDLAVIDGVSMSRLSHLFKECYGCSFQEFLLHVRCENAKKLLNETDQSLLDISISCGFSDPKYFNQGFRKIYGTTPKEYRRDAKKVRHKTFATDQDIIVKSGSFLTDEDCYLILEYCDDMLNQY